MWITRLSSVTLRVTEDRWSAIVIGQRGGGLEERAVETTRSALDYLEQVIGRVQLPIQVVGGLSVADCQRAFAMGVHSVAIGSPIVPGDSGRGMVEQLRQIVAYAEASS